MKISIELVAVPPNKADAADKLSLISILQERRAKCLPMRAAAELGVRRRERLAGSVGAARDFARHRAAL
jgi:hypothetical protein